PLMKVSDYAAILRYLPITIRVEYSTLEKSEKSAVVDTFVGKIGLRSQIHTGGFLFRRFLNCPLMKRDLLYRCQFTLDEIEQALIETGHEDHLNQILTDFRKKGSVLQLPTIKRLQADSGII